MDRTREIRVCRRTTKAITETILESAELARVNLQALHLMLSQTKNISYDHVKKTIHFYYFARTTAERHRVPGAVLWRNVSAPECSSTGKGVDLATAARA